MTKLEGIRALVIGAGRAGSSAATFLAQRDARVRVIDRSPGAQRDPKWPDSIELRAGADTDQSLLDIDLVVPSPGVPRDHPVLRSAVERGIPVWSEIELASRFLSAPILAITGTNGKSTTTTLLGAILRAAGGRVFVGGNLGTPLADAAADPLPYDVAVVEVSSFQLEWVDSFRAHVGVFLNLTPDHLDRYASVAEYGAAKARLLDGQQSGDFVVLNREDPQVWALRSRARGSVISFGREEVEFGTYVDGDDLVVRNAVRPERYSLTDSPLQGEHNRENIAAAATAASVWGVDPEAIRTGIRSTIALPHRLELVREVKGVRYFDDSKGTNVGAVEKSMASFPDGIVLLLGGYDKGSDFTALAPMVRQRVSHLVCFGKAGPAIQKQLEGMTQISVVPNLASAVEVAQSEATAGQVVLLSPGCASFDEFRDYNERGERFRGLVEGLE